MSFNKDKRNLVVINVVLGSAVILSYVHGFITHPETKGQLWGNVPQSLMTLYTISMLTAAAGYFAFSYYVLVHLDPGSDRVFGGYSYRVFHWLYILMLLPSALWMPLTFDMLEAPSGATWFAVRLVLAVVGLASLLLLWAVLTVKPGKPEWARRLAAAGAAAFSFQTAVLDALVWPYYFPAG